jgi:RND family efflux transporter MFP subunit
MLDLRACLLSVCCLFPVFTLAETALVTAEPAYREEVLHGFTRERTRLVLSAEASGRVEQVAGDVGEKTLAETPFACLDTTFIDLDLDANRQEQAALQVDRAYYRKEVKRIRQLLAQKSSSESQLDAAQRNLDKTQVQLKALEVARRTLQEKRTRHCIQPPEGWRIIRRHVEPGEWINAGEPVVEIGDYRHLLVPFALSVEEYQALRRQGDRLSVRLPQLDLVVPVTPLRVSPAFDEASRKITMELEIAETLSDSRGGLRAELSLMLPFDTGAVMLPASALLQRYEQYWLRRPGGEEVRVVYLGREASPDGDRVRVSSPEIATGDRFQHRPE